MALRKLPTLRVMARFCTSASSQTSQPRKVKAETDLTGSPHDVAQQHLGSLHRSTSYWGAISYRRYSQRSIARNKFIATPQIGEQDHRKLGKPMPRQQSSAGPSGEKDVNMRPKSKNIDWESLPAEDAARLKRLQIEYEVWKSQGYKVPVEMSDERWLILMNYNDEKYRQRLCAHWLRSDMRSQQYEEIQRQQEELWQQALLKPHPAGIPNAVNTFINFDQTVSNHNYCHFNNLAFAASHGIPLVLDMSFEKRMTTSEVIILAHQVKVTVNTVNSFSQDPFHLHFSGVVPGSNTHKALRVVLPKFDQHLPVTVTEDSYLEHYPKENLVYLTAKSPNMLENFNPNDVYIIGGIADNISWKKTLSYNKARTEGLRTAKFPLDLYFKWKSGPTKNLQVDVCLAIMLELKNSKDWRQALQNVPSHRYESWL